MRDWEELRRACAEDGESLEALARRYDIPYSTLKNRAVKENWPCPQAGDAPPGDGQAAFARVTAKLLRLIEQGLDGDGSVDFKEIKTLPGALRELQSLGESGGGGDGALTVRFLGETEEMSE